MYTLLFNSELYIYYYYVYLYISNINDMQINFRDHRRGRGQYECDVCSQDLRL